MSKRILLNLKKWKSDDEKSECDFMVFEGWVMAKTGRQYLFLITFLLLLLVIGFIILKNRDLIFKPEVQDSGFTKPAYLSQPIPKIDKIKTIVDNPKFKELKYVKSFFEPVETTTSGRANPFIPIDLEEK